MADRWCLRHRRTSFTPPLEDCCAPTAPLRRVLRARERSHLLTVACLPCTQSVLISSVTFWMHARNYYRPKQQRQILVSPPCPLPTSAERHPGDLRAPPSAALTPSRSVVAAYSPDATCLRHPLVLLLPVLHLVHLLGVWHGRVRVAGREFCPLWPGHGLCEPSSLTHSPAYQLAAFLLLLLQYIGESTDEQRAVLREKEKHKVRPAPSPTTRYDLR